MKTLGQDVGGSTTRVAKKTAKKVMQEPLEVLSTAKKQVMPEKRGITPSKPPDFTPKTESKITPQEEAKLKQQSKKMIEELEDEIEKIRMEKKQKEEERKQREQEELVKDKKSQDKPLTEPSTKPKRGMAGKVEKLKKKTEIRMPPSG
ncbi:hypothetical protein ACFL0F_01175 [Patescibacteria group bacterium]